MSVGNAAELRQLLNHSVEIEGRADGSKPEGMLGQVQVLYVRPVTSACMPRQ